MNHLTALFVFGMYIAGMYVRADYFKYPETLNIICSAVFWLYITLRVIIRS